MEEHRYNTQNKSIILPEYGRNVQIMVDHLLTIEDREERNRAAKAVIRVMGNLYPMYRDSEEYRHKLWDHLFIMSDFMLDTDSIYPKPKREEINKKPERVPYPRKFVKYRHYGIIVEKMVNEVQNQPTDELKKRLALLLALYMKKSYLTWNKDSVSDAQIVNDVNEMLGMELLHVDEDELKGTKESFNRRLRGGQNNNNRNNNRNNNNRNYRNNNKNRRSLSR